MTQESDIFLEALNDTVKNFFPVIFVGGFSLRLPLNGRPVAAQYTSTPFVTSAHDKLKCALFLQKVEDLFAENGAGDLWIKNSPFLYSPAEKFGFYTEEELEEKTYATEKVTSKNAQPRFEFTVHEKWVQIDNVRFDDGMLYKDQRNPPWTFFKTLKKQEEFKRFLHLISSIEGPMKLWKTYYYKTSFTIRAPSKAVAFFIAQAFLNNKKSFKSDTYDVENSYRIFGSEVETEEEIQKARDEMKALTFI
jgi:hypothetical protein